MYQHLRTKTPKKYRQTIVQISYFYFFYNICFEKVFKYCGDHVETYYIRMDMTSKVQKTNHTQHILISIYWFSPELRLGQNNFIRLETGFSFFFIWTACQHLLTANSWAVDCQQPSSSSHPSLTSLPPIIFPYVEHENSWRLNVE